MPNLSLAIRTGLSAVAAPRHHGTPGRTGVTLTELAGVSLAMLTVRGDQTATLSEAIKRAIAIDLPHQSSRSTAGAVTFIWAGYGQWLAIGAPSDDLAQRLASCVGASGSVVYLRGGRTIIRIAGARARDGLMKVVPVDLDDAVFTTQSAALTAAEHIPVALWKVDDAPTYAIACPRSYAESLWAALLASFAEYGCDVIASGP